MERLDGVCGHCAPYKMTCEHACPTCGGVVEMDNCDVDCEDSTQGVKCSEGCYTWFHNECGDTKNNLCKPCQQQPAVA